MGGNIFLLNWSLEVGKHFLCMEMSFNIALPGRKWTLFWVTVCYFLLGNLQSNSISWHVDSLYDYFNIQVQRSKCFMKAMSLSVVCISSGLLSCQWTDCRITIRIQEPIAAGSKWRVGKHMSPAWYFSFLWICKVEISQQYCRNC